MPPRVHLVHRARDRLRLRIPEKRKDLRFFLELYDDLRQIPGVTDVVINPVTGSILLHFPGEPEANISDSLRRIGLLSPDAQGKYRPGVLCRLERFFDMDQSGASHVRTVLFAVIVALAIHQVRRGKLLVPAMSVLWYAYDLVASHKKERAPLQAGAQTPFTPPEE